MYSEAKPPLSGRVYSSVTCKGYAEMMKHYFIFSVVSNFFYEV